jgi:hypothetical protein
MTSAIDNNSGRDTSAADLLNEQFHVLLRDAADKREGRARTQVKEDAAAAAEESRALFALARGQTGSRPGPAGNPVAAGNGAISEPRSR